jgi:hypothetical protein
MRVVVTGSRDWTDRKMIRRQLAALPAGSIVIHGRARGADMLADEEADKLRLQIKPVPARWEVTEDTPHWAIREYHGRPYDSRAGRVRNREMLDLRPELVLAFHDDLYGASKGTLDCVEEAQRRGITVEVHAHGRETVLLAGAQPALFD